ncbi:MAG: protease modulator HflC [Candidatus Cloacimonetes bacterium]|jgi:modulator of FtsH protease HflC|nr:protease modulator HflC [Candidatus Cloacimonadota bacterium]MBT7469994.1 protease modulator HflC [Candidatus Cloacimonadota bacterium]
MKKTIIFFAIVAIIILNAFYVVDEKEQVIITQFGDPVGEAITAAGLHIKVPFIHKVHYFEKRVLEWDGDPKQIPTSDKRYIWLDTFSRWQIIDPLKFYETTRYENSAHSRLDDIISGTTRDVVSSYNLIEIVRDSNREMEFTQEYSENTFSDDKVKNNIEIGREQISIDIFNLAKPKIAEYGIELIDVQIKRLNYNKEVQSKVFDRMISERNKIAAKYRSEGEGKTSEILGKMQKELDQIQSDAYKIAEEIKGEADAKAIKIYADAYNLDTEFYEFMKTLETYEQTINKKTTLIMTTDSDYYKFIKQSN